MTKPCAAILALMLLFVSICGCQGQNGGRIVTEQPVVPTEQLEPEPEFQPKLSPEPEPEPEPEQQPEPQQQLEPQPEPQLEPEPQPEPRLEPEQQPEPQPESKPQTEPQTEPKPELKKQVPVESKEMILFEKCNRIFTKYVDHGGMVDYKTLRRKRVELIPALMAFEKLHPAELISLSDKEKIAFWINAYNIFTIKVIIDNYPIEPRWWAIIYPDSSIMQIPGAWDKEFFKVMGLEYTLREIEKEILMQRFRDLRIPLALSYASMSSAFLRNEAYTGEKLDRQLDEQTRKFLSSQRGIQIDRQNNTVHLSDIFNWYKDSFVSKYASIKKFRDRPPKIRAYLNFIVPYLSYENARYLESKDYIIRFQSYDWRLNERTAK